MYQNIQSLPPKVAVTGEGGAVTGGPVLYTRGAGEGTHRDSRPLLLRAGATAERGQQRWRPARLEIAVATVGGRLIKMLGTARQLPAEVSN
ncbi:Hypp1760 [Branchiostoma lanceolatum]|uniref:Hypp1760 protein n=1 Tax=Branchiostoma lanceolatum TaxID=7740 RepID=A0A8J9ZK96_BRALA|nr:Hypp1760 [Branchiostoma lanceolatum]